MHHLTMSMLLIESGAASTESSENSFAKLSPASWEIFSLEPENHGGDLCYLIQEENVTGRDHARQVTTAWSFAVKGQGIALARACWKERDRERQCLLLKKTLQDFQAGYPPHYHPHAIVTPVLQFQQRVTQTEISCVSHPKAHAIEKTLLECIIHKN